MISKMIYNVVLHPTPYTLHSTLRIIVGIADEVDRIDKVDKVDKVDKRKPTIEWAFLIHCLRMNFY